jgi:hypothetical protein
MMERRLGRIELDNPLGVTVFENHANPGHLLLSGSVFGRQCERSLGYLPIRLIFAIMGHADDEGFSGRLMIDGHAHKTAKATRRFP